MHNVGLTDNMDSALTKKGCGQVHGMGKWLKDNFDLTDYIGLTSPYHRTLQTACAVSKHTGLKFSVHGGSREYHIEKAALTESGITIPNRKKGFPKIVWPSPEWNADSVFYENEELEQFFERTELFIKSLRPSGKYVIIGHGASCRTLHEILCGKELDELRHRYAGPIPVGTFSCSISNASLSWVVDGESRWFSKVVHDENVCGLDDDAGS